MSVQRLHAFEKTAIQARHTIKRLEAVLESSFATDSERKIAEHLLEYFKGVRNAIPEKFVDVDLREKE